MASSESFISSINQPLCGCTTTSNLTKPNEWKQDNRSTHVCLVSEQLLVKFGNYKMFAVRRKAFQLTQCVNTNQVTLSPTQQYSIVYIL